MTKVLKTKKKNNATDIALMVESTAQEEFIEFDKNKIIDALQNEMSLSYNQSVDIASEVVNRLYKINLETITTSLIREFVNVVLYEKGYHSVLKSENAITVPLYDITNLIENATKENGNTTHNPESVNLALAERLLKEYNLKSQDVQIPKNAAKAHLEGKIHIHDLGMFNRFYCSGHSIEYIKKNGIKNVPTIMSTSAPANSAWVLARHICSITQFFSSMYAGAIGWDAVNVFFSPLLKGWKYKNIKQLAQTLIFDSSQLTGAKGGQNSFIDFNVYIDAPNHFRETFAMGKSGQFMVEDNLGDLHYFKTREETEEFANVNSYKVLKYKDFEKESKLFLKAILEVIKKGDAVGMPFAFPKINMHINGDTFNSPQSIALLKLACEASSEKGCPYFIFDRNAFSMSQCCRLKIDFSEDDKKMTSTPEELRFIGGQNVSINLPNCSLENPNDDDFYNELIYRMDLACQTHIARKNYLLKLMDLPNSPLRFYKQGMDGKPYAKTDKISWLIGIVGLNECVYNLIGQELHESEEAFEKGIEIATFMNMQIKELEKKYGLTLKLEESPAESTAGRFARLDIKKFKDKAFVKNNEKGVYYTNSVHFATDSDVDYITRLMEQSKFHSLVEAGSMIHIWSGENKPSPEGIYKLVETTWFKTNCVQWVLSPEYTICKHCNKTFNGLLNKCPDCGNENVLSVTRITGYYVITENFNRDKQAELKDRKRELII